MCCHLAQPAWKGCGVWSCAFLTPAPAHHAPAPGRRMRRAGRHVPACAHVGRSAHTARYRPVGHHAAPRDQRHYVRLLIRRNTTAKSPGKHHVGVPHGSIYHMYGVVVTGDRRATSSEVFGSLSALCPRSTGSTSYPGAAACQDRRSVARVSWWPR